LIFALLLPIPVYALFTYLGVIIDLDWTYFKVDTKSRVVLRAGPQTLFAWLELELGLGFGSGVGLDPIPRSVTHFVPVLQSHPAFFTDAVFL